MARQDRDRLTPKAPYPIIARKPDWLEDTLAGIERLVPRFLRPKNGSIFSLKNRILFATLSIVIGGVFFIGVILQLTVFPKLRGDPSVILNLKIIHFVVSVVVIAVSFLFIELVSKKITLPLMELTKTADQISREAGEPLAPSSAAEVTGPADAPDFRDDQAPVGDEIFQLMSSFNRMIAHLKASETHLRDSEEKYRFLFDNSPFPIFVIDAQTMEIVDVNARAEEEYQYTQRELLGMNFVDLMPVQYRKFTNALLREIGPTEETLLPVLHHKRRDGSTFLVNFQARLSRFRDQPAIIAGVWDVTEKLEKHAMLIQAGKMASRTEPAAQCAEAGMRLFRKEVAFGTAAGTGRAVRCVKAVDRQC
jgi:PAS domain S-box-containing protein